ncbi:MAG: hypothetical protein JXR68_05790, partial [Bacteroidales bacterium]|nr:hypothetical protein [Bacteroidales bacterium]
MKKFLLNLILLVFLSTFVGFSQIPQVKFLDAASQTANIQTSPNDKNTKPVTYFSVDNNKLLKNKSPKGVLWSDDFSTDKGWTLGGSYWQRGVAIAEPDDDHTATSDGYILACPLGTDYPNNMVREDATSPTIDCSSYSNVQLSFWSFSGCESSSWDHLGLEVYDGSAWQTLFTNGGSFQETSWNQYSWDVSAYADGNANFRFRFYMGSTDGTETYSGWGLDDIELSGDLVGENTITAGSSVEPATISSLIDTEAESFLNFDFTVKDDGSTPATDVLNTLINEIVISQAAGNDIATWSDAIEGATLTDGTTTIYGTVNATDITFSAITNNVGELGYIADNQSKTYTLKIWLKSSLGGTLPTTIDKQNFVFEVTNNSFSLEATSSGFAIGENENSGNTKNEVIVTATQLIFIGQPSSTASSGVALAQQPVIYATDENGNVDTDINSAVTLSNSGTLLITNNSMSFVNGVADFSGSGFMFTTGGEYVTLSATTGALSTISPSTEIAVDIIGCEFFAEDFNLISTKRDLDGEGDWFYTELTNSSNDWGIAARAGNGNCLTIYNNGTAYQYNNGNDGDEIAYYNVQIDATGYRDVTIEFDWQCNGETWYDYGQIMWSTDGTNWSIANQTEFAGQGTWTTGTYDLSVVDGQQFYIAFRWRNDGSVGSNPPFAVDNISIKGIPDFKYNFSYRQDLFEPITGTVVTADGNDGVNISLPAGFDFKYDGVAISNVRANINGWVEMGTSYLANAEINTLNNAGTIPFLAPLWDDLTADAQTRIIYATEGTTPTRVFTIEWLDVLWGGQRQNFQVKLYETSYVIEFWYGIMHSNAAGSASIGINNAGLCMNKQISITPGTTPSASYNVENNSINSTTNLNPGLVYIFNPL